MESLQEKKLHFAKSQGIEPCTNSGCKFEGCTCGSRCACDKEKEALVAEELHCNECTEFKLKMKKVQNN